MASNIQTVDSAVEPVTVDEVKTHLRLETDADDTYLEFAISAARQRVEKDTDVCLITQTWTLTLDDWPVEVGGEAWWDGVREAPRSFITKRDFVLPATPLLAITKVALLDEADTETIVSTDTYYAVTNTRPGKLALRRGATWPTVHRDHGGIVITYTAGYGPDPTDAPADLRQAVKMMAAHIYENREIVTMEGAVNTVPNGYGRIVLNNRQRRI